MGEGCSLRVQWYGQFFNIQLKLTNPVIQVMSLFKFRHH